MPITIDSILVRDSEPVATTLDENVVVLSVRDGSYFDFNRVGSDIWNMLAKPRPLREILDRLAEIYEVDLGTMAPQVVAFLQKLVDNRLVRVLEPQGDR